MDYDPTVQTVLSFYFRQPDMVRQIEPLGSAGGWSGSRLWRINNQGGESFCLRQWPSEHPSKERLQHIHAVLARVARQGMKIIPAALPTLAQSTILEQGGRRWELTPWLPGQADFHTHPTPARLRSALQALAQFHTLSALGQQPLTGAAPCLTDRRQQLHTLLTGQIDQISVALAAGLEPKLDLRGNAILSLTRNRLGDLQQRIDSAARQTLQLQPAIRDIHHDHLLFTGDELTGIVDFGALRMDSPLTDIARLLGSLVGDNQADRQLAISAYSELRPLTSADIELINLLDESGLILGTLNWLTWLYLDRRNMGPLDPILNRLDEIISRLRNDGSRIRQNSET